MDITTDHSSRTMPISQSDQSPCRNHNSSKPLETDNFPEEAGDQKIRSKKKQKLTKRENNKNGIIRRYVGVRQRPSGRWVAEIKHSSQKLRLWLGTFDSAEEAAMAYDNAARLLRGKYANTNFHYHTYEENCINRLGKNPRLLQVAIMKNQNHARSTFDHHLKSNINGVSNPSWNGNKVDFDTLVEQTIFCSSSSVHHDDNNNNNLCQALSLGRTSKVYSSVVVAPSFSSSLDQGGADQKSTCQDRCLRN